MRGIHYISLLVLLTGQLVSTSALAVFPDITGTYAGNRTQTRYGCTPLTGPGSAGAALQEGTVNTRYREVTLSNFDPVAGTFSIDQINEDLNGDLVLVRTGSGRFISDTQIQRDISGATSIGGTVTNTAISTIGLDSTGTYVVGFGKNYGPGGSNGVIDNTNVGKWRCNISATGNADRISAAPVAAVTTTAVTPEVTPSNTVTSNAATLSQVVTTTTAALGSRVQSALSGARRGGSNGNGNGGFRKAANNYILETPSGLSAGDTFNNIGVWASYAYSSFDNDFFRTKYDGTRHMVFAGADFTPRDNIVLGLAVGYEDTNMDTDFNQGKLDADGWTIAPYFGMTLNDTWSIDASMGYSDIDTDQNRSNGGITSDVDTKRWFFSANVNGFTQVDNWFLSARVGILNAESTDDDFSEIFADGSLASNVAERSSLLTQVNIGGEAAYSMGDFEPFVSATYNYDTHATETNLTGGVQPSNDHDDLLIGLGFRYYNDNGLSITTQYDTRTGRSDIDESTLSVSARLQF